MTAIPSYETLVRSSLDSMAEAADMLDHISSHPEAAFLAQMLVLGAQVYATLAQAEAEQDSIRYFEKRNPQRNPVRPSMSTPVRPVTPINKFQKDAE